MKLCTLLLALVVLAVSAAASEKTSDQQALLALHEQARQAHLKGDADLLTSSMAGLIVDVGRGKVETFTREQLRERFTKYFRMAKYASWDNMAPPVVHIAPDGRSGWMAVQVSARITMTEQGKAPEQIDYQGAWLASYEKQRGKWVMVAIAYSVPPGK